MRLTFLVFRLIHPLKYLEPKESSSAMPILICPALGIFSAVGCSQGSGVKYLFVFDGLGDSF